VWAPEAPHLAHSSHENQLVYRGTKANKSPLKIRSFPLRFSKFFWINPWLRVGTILSLMFTTLPFPNLTLTNKPQLIISFFWTPVVRWQQKGGVVGPKSAQVWRMWFTEFMERAEKREDTGKCMSRVYRSN